MWGEMQFSGNHPSTDLHPFRQPRTVLPHRLRIFAGTANPVCLALQTLYYDAIGLAGYHMSHVFGLTAMPLAAVRC